MQEEYVRTYNGAHGLPRSVTHPHGGVGQAAYELAARITAETKVAAIDYLAIARARDPEESLREHLLSGQAGATFLALSKKHRLDLCIERLTIDLAETYALGDDLVTAAAARLAYFESQ